MTEQQPSSQDGKEAVGWAQRFRWLWFRLWTGWLATGLTVLGLVVALAAESIVSEVVAFSDRLSFWQHIAVFGMVWVIEAMYVTSSVVFSLIAPTLGLLVGGAGLLFPEGRTRFNIGSVVCCILVLAVLFFRHRLYRVFL